MRLYEGAATMDSVGRGGNLMNWILSNDFELGIIESPQNHTAIFLGAMAWRGTKNLPDYVAVHTVWLDEI